MLGMKRFNNIKNFYNGNFAIIWLISGISAYIFIIYLVLSNIPNSAMCDDYGTLNNIEVRYLSAYDKCITDDNRLEIDKDEWNK